jgi:hypothetical protein
VSVLVGFDGSEGLGVGGLAPHQHGMASQMGEPVAQAHAGEAHDGKQGVNLIALQHCIAALYCSIALHCIGCDLM